jgi:hypothetical protein
MSGSAARGAESAGLTVAPDLARRVARFREVHIPYHATSLTVRERALVEKLVEASRYLEDIFWRQSDPEALTLYQSLAGSRNADDLNLRRYLWINASKYDLLQDNQPFVGTQPMPPGRGFYPQGLTQAQVERYLKDHPGKKEEIYSPTTVVRWHGDQLEGLPYHIAYRSFLEPAAKALNEAASLSDDPAFAKFLRLRAEALLSDDYFASDLAWLELKEPKFDIIFGPYETYLDGLLGVKGSYGGAVLIRYTKESKRLDMFQKHVPEIQDSLPLSPADRPSKQGQETPLEVMEAPFRSGDLTHGYQAVADNLPNDPRIHERTGSKKIFFKNFMDARVDYVMVPLARQLMRPDQAAKVTSEGYMMGTILHEISHGLGPAFARTAAGKVSIRESIGPIYAGLEEAKADMVGMYALKWLVDGGALPKQKLQEYYASYVGDLLRTVRFGVGEAHGQAELMEFNYLRERGAIRRGASGRYAIDYTKVPAAIADLSAELLDMEAKGDRVRAESWFKKYDVLPEELKVSLESASGVPVDIDPVYSFPEKAD